MSLFDPKNSETIGYHFFLEPTGAVQAVLCDAIQQLAVLSGSPVFAPHVTLLARIEGERDVVLEGAQALARECSPLHITLGDIGMEDAYFRALYLHATGTGLERAHLEAARQMGMSGGAPYLPHLSLMYANLDAATKERFLEQILIPTDLSWTADALHVYRTPGSVETWEHIASFPFIGNT